MPQVPPSGDTGSHAPKKKAPAKKAAPARKSTPSPHPSSGGGGGGGGGNHGGYLNYAQLEALAMHAGASQQEAITLAAIAMAESGGRIAAHNTNANTGDNSYSLWQINMLGGMGPQRRAALGLSSNDELFNPVTNARAALYILRSGGFKQWSTFSSGAYTAFVPHAEAAISNAASVNVAHLNVSAKGVAGSGGSVGDGGAGAEKNALNSPGLVSQFGYLAAYLNDPVLGGILRDYAQNHKGNTGWLLSQLEKTDWWKHHSQTARELGALQKTDPASFRQSWDQQRQTIAQEASQMGVKIAPNRLNQLTTTSMFSGWDAGQLTQAIGAEFHYDPNAKYVGTAGNTIQKLRALSGQYLVPMGDGALQSWTRQVLEGKKSGPDDFNNYLAEQAKSLYPWMAKAIDKQGMTPTQYLDPYRQAAAQTLELDPGSIDLSNHKWRNLFEQVDPKTGERSERGLANAMTLMRTDPRYNYDSTQGAKQEAASLAQTIAQSFGFAA